MSHLRFYRVTFKNPHYDGDFTASIRVYSPTPEGACNTARDFGLDCGYWNFNGHPPYPPEEMHKWWNNAEATAERV